MPDFNASLQITAKSEIESLAIINALQVIANNLTPENIKVLASKSATPGINGKIQQFKYLI